MIAVGFFSVLIWLGIFLYRLLNGKGIVYIWYIVTLGGVAYVVFKDPSSQSAIIGTLWALFCFGSLIALPFFYKNIFEMLDRPVAYEKEQYEMRWYEEQSEDSDIIQKAKSHKISQIIEEKLEEENFAEDAKEAEFIERHNNLINTHGYLVRAYQNKFDELSDSMPYIFIELSNLEYNQEASSIRNPLTNNVGIHANLRFIDGWFAYKASMGRDHYSFKFMQLDIICSGTNNEPSIRFNIFDEDMVQTNAVKNNNLNEKILEKLFEKNWEKILLEIKRKNLEDEFLYTYIEMKKEADKRGLPIHELTKK